MSNDEACIVSLWWKQGADTCTVLHTTHELDREDPAERPRLGIPHTEAMYAYQTPYIPKPNHSLTLPKVSYDSTPTDRKVADDPDWDLHPPNPLPVLVRASDGDTQSKDRVKNKDHVKFSTVVQPNELEAFFTRYAEVCKAGFQSLKKRDRKGRKRDKGKKKKAGEGEKKG